MKSKWFSVSIAILVSAVMVFGSMPFGIFAAGNTGWYDGSKTSFTISTPEELIGFAKLVDDGITFEGKTVMLGADIDLDNKLFNPIGSYGNDKPFKGVFDGKGHSIKNLSQNTWELDTGYYYGDLGLGLFGLVRDATIKNLRIDGADISGESAICGTVAACAYGDCVFENISIANANVADYQYYSGGIVGWASGNHRYEKCNVEDTVVVAAQRGDFENSTGGLIGGAGGSAQIFVKDTVIACRIDAYNDVTSTYRWYAYRRCGMIIGNTDKTVTVNGTTYADAPQLTAENVHVIYGDWVNYTYCEFAGTSWPYVRVQAGISNSAYSNPRYGHPTDANGKTVVDDDHVHNDGEDHFIECTFDQLYGGGQGVYGAGSHAGVAVHKASDIMSSDEDGHWYDCVYKGGEHGDCGFMFDYCEHLLDTESFVKDESGHYNICEVCGEMHHYGDHVFSEWIVTSEATESEEGSRYRECTVCKMMLDIDSIPRLEKSIPEYIYWLPNMLLMNTSYKFTAEAGEGGYITPEGTTWVLFGGSLTYSITPMEGYEISAVYIDGRNIGTPDEYTFERIITGHTIRVEFAPIDGGK